MKKIKLALISVYDKNNLKFLIKNLNKFKIKLISSGGTYKEIKKMGFECEEVSKLQIVLKFCQEGLKHSTLRYMLVYCQREN